MPLYQTSAGDRILAADIDQFYNLLKGVAASGEAITLIYNGTSLIFQPSSDPSAGTRVLDIKNAAGTHLASLDFNGVLELLAAAAAPGGAVAGALYWDTLLSALRVHDGTNWRDIAGSNAGPLPNLVLNSDFGRRTVFGLAMPEVFADTSAWSSASALGVASNILTITTGSKWAKWSGPNTMWRDGRWSGTFKAISTTGVYLVSKYIDANDALNSGNTVNANMNNGTFSLQKIIAGTPTTVASVAQALTLNRWYWMEVEAQGTTYVVKIYDTGGTTPGVTKASSTLLQTLTGTIADAGVASGGVAVFSDQASSQWGGIATGNGGVYVETWLPESYSVTFGGTLGGQAIGFDESADSGPGTVAGAPYKQWAIRGYVPAASRTITMDHATPDGSLAASTTYTGSGFAKVSGLGGSGALVSYQYLSQTSAQGNVTVATRQDDGGSTSWVRKTIAFASGATARRGRLFIYFNPDSSATGTGWADLLQLEQGSAATAWRNAPADDAPINYELINTSGDKTTTSAALVEFDSRDSAVNLFLPWDCDVTLHVNGAWTNSAISNLVTFGATSDAVAWETGTFGLYVVASTGAAANAQVSIFARKRLAAGKHRVALTWKTSAGTATGAAGTATAMIVGFTLSRGK